MSTLDGLPTAQQIHADLEALEERRKALKALLKVVESVRPKAERMVVEGEARHDVV